MTVITNIYDQFAAIVDDVAVKLNYAVEYQYGHPIEIGETLSQMSKMPAKAGTKYPLIALFTDITEEKGNRPGIESDVKLHLIIAINTLQRYTTPERLTINFIPKLYPIYDQLLKSIRSSGFFAGGTPSDLSHTKTDRFRYGKTGIYANSAEIFPDKLDCIEIENMKLATILQTCKITTNL